jgi:hypothetical protein
MSKAVVVGGDGSGSGDRARRDHRGGYNRSFTNFTSGDAKRDCALRGCECGIIEEVAMARDHTLLGRTEEAGQEGEKASLRRRCRCLLRGTLLVPGQRRGGGDGGKLGVPLARQSDGGSAGGGVWRYSSGADWAGER